MQGIFVIAGITVLTLTIWGVWRVFEKAGEPGWKALIPGYNLYKLTEISRNSGWWFIAFFLFLSPYVPYWIAPSKFSVQDYGLGNNIFDLRNAIFSNGFGNEIWLELSFIASAIFMVFFWAGLVKVMYDLSDSFGRSLFFAFGLTFLPFIFFPILGFGGAAYQDRTDSQNESIEQRGKYGWLRDRIRYFFVVLIVFLLSINPTNVLFADDFGTTETIVLSGILTVSLIAVYWFNLRALNDGSKNQADSNYTLLRPIYLLLFFVIIGIIFFGTYFLVNSQSQSAKSCATQSDVLCEEEYSEIVERAKNAGNASTCNEAKAYIKYKRVGIAGEREIKISEDKATESCFEAVKQNIESQSSKSEKSPFAQDVPDSWSRYRNDEYGFTFRYPKNWQYQADSRGGNQHLICLSPEGPTGDCPGLITVNKNTDLESWYQQMYGEKNLSRSNVSVDGASGILVKDSNDENKTSDGLIFEKGGFVYHIKFFPEYQNKFKKLVSSFNFEE